MKRNKVNVVCISLKSKKYSKFITLIKLFKASKDCDIIHVHGCSYLGFLPIVLGVWIGRLFRKKIIITYHGGGAESFLDKYRFLIPFFLSNANKILVPSSFLQNVFTKYGIKTQIFPNMISVGRFKYISRKQIRPLILVVKHLEEIYDIETAIKAFSIIKGTFKDAKLKIVGSGSKEKQLKSLVYEMKLSDVEFVGQIKHEDISEIYVSGDIFLNTSLFESFGMVILEAFASGLIVISTNVGGIPDIIRDGENGFLVKPGDYKAFAEKVFYILNNQNKSHDISLKAKHVADKYDLDSFVSSLKSLYNDALLD